MRNVPRAPVLHSIVKCVAVSAVIAAALVSLSVCRPVTMAEEDKAVELVNQLGGEVGGVVIDGAYAYVGIGTRVVVLSIEGGRDLRLVGTSELLPATIADLVVVDGVVVVALGEAGVAVIDVHNPLRPRLVGRLQVEKAYHLEVTDGQVLVFAGNTILTVDVGSPEDCVVTGTLQPFAWVGRGRFTLMLENQLLVASNSDLVAVDVSDPSRLSIEKWIESREVWGIAASDSAVFAPILVSNPETGVCRMVLHALDRAPDNLLGEVGELDLPSCDPMQAMLMDGSYLLVRYRGGLQMVDVHNPAQMVLGPYVDLPLDGVMSTMTRPRQMALDSDRLYLTTNTSGEAGPGALPGGLVVVDLSDRRLPTLGGGWFEDAPGVVSQSAIAGDYLVLLGGLGDVVRLYDIAVPEDPTMLSTFAPETTPWDIAADSSWLVMAEGDGLRVVDLSDPRHPTPRGTWKLRNNVRQVAIDGSVVYAGVEYSSESGPEWRELLVFQLSADGGLELQRRVDVCKSAMKEMVVAGDTMYVLCRDEGLIATDVRNRFVPVPGGAISAGRWAMAFVVGDGLGFIATRETTPPAERARTPNVKYGGLHVVDVSDAGNIRSMGVFSTALTFPGNAQQWGLVSAGPRVLMAAGERALRVVDVRDPDHPHQVEVVPVPTDISNLARIGQFVYAAGHEGGLYVFRVLSDSPPEVRGQALLPLTVSRR